MKDYSSHALFVSHVLGLVLVLFVCGNRTQLCGQQGDCLGYRPRLPSGCCPVEAGQVCRPANGEQCDVTMGFQCLDKDDLLVQQGDGVCQGLYNLHVTSRAEEEVSLEWTPFIPDDYEYEYVLLYKDSSNNDTDWTEIDCGNQPFYALRRLKPNTPYSIKVAIWEDVFSGTLGNTSETIMVHTMPVKFCKYAGQKFEVNQNFAYNCEDNCTCLPTGQLDCFNLCPEEDIPEVKEGCRLKQGQGCCDWEVSCPEPEKRHIPEPCHVNGVKHPHGAEFEHESGYCVCHHGKLDCECEEECDQLEPSSTCLNPRQILDGQCCPVWECDPVCQHENETYAVGQVIFQPYCGPCECLPSLRVKCTDCPHVEMVLPDAACPNPHIRKDKCCDTLECFDPSESVENVISSIFAISLTPRTLTVSFPVSPNLNEMYEIPQYYNIMYANTADSLVRWQVEKVTVREVSRTKEMHSFFSEKSAGFAEDSPVVVKDRVYTTLTNLQPNTSFYLYVEVAEEEEDMPRSSPRPREREIFAMVVAKTIPLENVTTCIHEGVQINHGKQVPSHCSLECTCHMGQIRCQNVCQSHDVMLVASPSCPVPRLENMDGFCCPQWICYPADTGCRHKGVILHSGQSVRDGCNTCKCNNGTVTCASVCPSIGQAPRPNCRLSEIVGHCCPLWSCPIEKSRPLAVVSSVQLNFDSKCKQPISKFATDVREKVTEHVMNKMKCSDQESSDLMFCDILHVVVDCSGKYYDASERRRRSASESGGKDQAFQAFVSAEMSLSPQKTADKELVYRMERFGFRLQEKLNSSFVITLSNGDSIQSLNEPINQGLFYVCPTGFSFSNDYCVLTEIESTDWMQWSPNLKPVDDESHSVTLLWNALPDSIRSQISHVLISYRMKGSRQWIDLTPLPNARTSVTLTSLTPGAEYESKMLVMTSWGGERTWTAGQASFRTVAISEITDRNLTLSAVFVSDSCSVLIWEQLSAVARQHVTKMAVLYKRSESDSFTDRMEIPLTNHQNFANLTELSSNTRYTTKLVVSYDQGDTLSSSETHFTTKESGTSTLQLVIIILMVAVLIALLANIVRMLLCFYWRKRKKKEDNTGFVNKTYGMALETNGDTPNTVTPTVA